MRRVLAALAAFVVLSGAAVPHAQGTVSTPTAGQMNAHFINVGQGAATLLEFTCGAALIDTGGEKNDDFDSTSALERYLDAFFQRRTDLNRRLAMVVISHAHIDHTRGLPKVLAKYDVRLLVDNGLETGSGGRQQKAAHAKAKASGSSLKWQPIEQPMPDNKRRPPTSTLNCAQRRPQFTFLWGALDPDDEWPKSVLDNGNDSSVVTRVDFGDTSFLFPGDIEEDVQEELIEDTCPNGLNNNCRLDVDIYHVSHHGSHNGTSTELMDAMRPKAAVFSMGPANRRGAFTAVAHGHPRQATINVLLAAPNGVQDSRPSITVKVARKGSRAKQPTGPQFVDTTLTKALFATGWDGTIVFAARANKTWDVIPVP